MAERARCREDDLGDREVEVPGSAGPSSVVDGGTDRNAVDMTNEERIKRLEAQIERLEAKEAEVRQQLMDAQLDQWRARIEDLEVQAHLAGMETSDRIAAAREGVERVVSAVSDRVIDLRDTVTARIRDARGSNEDAAREQHVGR